MKVASPPAPMAAPMHVSLAFLERRVNVWLRFGQPVREIVLDRWRRVAVFMPGAVCCRVKWLGNDFGTALWQLMVLQAPRPLDDAQRISGVSPGARILLRADGEPRVKAVLAAVEAIDAAGLDPCAAAPLYWRMVDNRLAARQPLPAYTPERHAAHLAREALR
ncbi:DUF2840 domain-containing protein [Simplicispira suum]|uniref:Transposase n=1 Tax=Simplicispira suum TaxID=2109915 RepID=A0A2S0N323_9BURK|nr:DUF2840 domain-containing protein [Simplicispira suum]AVO42549.1 transposase [Simplicispira suum]